MEAPPTLHLKPKRSKPIAQYHPWVFSGAIARTSGSPTPGGLVDVVDAEGQWLAKGYFNRQSQIRARLLSWDRAEPIDAKFWRRRLERAIALRKTLNFGAETNARRLVFGEADGLPGLIVDQYGDYLVVQCLTLGIAERKTELAALLEALLEPAGIIERSDVDVRHKEGLPPESGLLFGSAPPAGYTVKENGFTFQVDLLEGQKTGHYIDQRDNRRIVGQPHIVGAGRVLNAFSYTGGFAPYVAAAGAREIVNVDSAVRVLEMAEANMIANGFERPQDEYLAGNAFEVLRDYARAGEQFDLVIVDPPKLAQDRRGVDRAARAYKDINLSALKLVRPGGWLATFSCSGLVSQDLFQKILFGASVDAKRNAQITRTLTQAADHPVLLSFPESAYLKGYLCRVW